MPKLTKRVVDDLKSGETDRLIFDDEMPRFGIRVMRSGLKSYVVQYRKDGHTRRFAFAKLVLSPRTRLDARLDSFWQQSIEVKIHPLRDNKGGQLQRSRRFASVSSRTM
jgi:hypothetical protein